MLPSILTFSDSSTLVLRARIVIKLTAFDQSPLQEDLVKNGKSPCPIDDNGQHSSVFTGEFGVRASLSSHPASCNCPQLAPQVSCAESVIGTKAGKVVERSGKFGCAQVVSVLVGLGLADVITLQPETPRELPALASERKQSACPSFPPKRAR